MATVLIRGKPVRFNEGDVVVTSSLRVRRPVTLLLHIANRGVGTHVATVVRHQGEIVVVGVSHFSWTDSTGHVWPGGGLTREPLALFEDPKYDHVSICRPHVPRTSEQVLKLRVAVDLLLKTFGTDTPVYDGYREFLHSGLGWDQATVDKWHCVEMAAILAKIQGAWPEGQTPSTDIGGLVENLGTLEQVF
jgi:hypothetical protein